MLRTKYLIIGNSAGGIGAVEAIREADERGPITILSDEAHPAYSRPLLPYYLSGERPREKLLFRPPDFYDEKGVTALLGRKAVRLDVGGRRVWLEDGEEILWEKLLLATGGTPNVSGMEGARIFTFNTLDDAARLDDALNRGARRAVVIGAGLIGVGVAQALRKRGVEVTLVARSPRVLSLILDEAASALAAAALASGGIKIVTGSGGEKVEREGREVALGRGERIPCDLVVVARGVLPRSGLAREAGIKVNRGIVVNRYMETDAPDIYACGDAAEAYDFIYGENRLNPLWPNAYIGGRTAGHNMAGLAREYPGGAGMTALRCFGLPIIAVGMTNPEDGFEVLSRSDGNTYRKFVLREGKIKGMILVGKVGKAGLLLRLIREEVEVDRFREALVSEDFGLALLPEGLRRRVLEVPHEELVLA